jgi:hypothetical protein
MIYKERKKKKPIRSNAAGQRRSFEETKVI